ncbi:unnamed protein product [Umbelopsis ramanniana]
MRFIPTICLLLAVITAHAATAKNQLAQNNISTDLGYDLIYKQLLEVNSLAHKFQKDGQLGSGLQVVAAEEQLEKLFASSTLKCTTLNRQLTPDEAKLLFAQTMDIVKQFDDSLRTFIALKEKYQYIFAVAGLEPRIKGLEGRVDALGDCFKTHIPNELAKNAADIRAQIDKIFADAYAQLKK